jgi:uncharacterized protein YndB with AHSA1/START domain
VTDPTPTGSSRTSRVIRAPREVLYQAFLDPEALDSWLAPDTMTGKVHEFDGRVGGGYEMSLFYDSADSGAGKTTKMEDRFKSRFEELTPPRRIVQNITFDSPDPAFAGTMTMIVTLEPAQDGTTVTIAFENIPPGIRPEDNDAGTRQSLAKLARYVEQRPKSS